MSNKVNHRDIVKEVSAVYGAPEKQVRTIIDTYLEIIKRNTLDGIATHMAGIGSIILTESQEKRAWSFKDKAVKLYPPRQTMKMKFSRKLMDEIKKR